MTQYESWRFAGEDTPLGLRHFLPAVLRANNVRAVELRVVERGPSLQGRTTSQEVAALADAARERYTSEGVPFWDALMTLALAADSSTRLKVFEQAMYHRSESNGQLDHQIIMESFVSTLESTGYHDNSERGIIALTSQMATGAGLRHLPLLDFRVSPSPAHTEVVTEMLSILGRPGFLVNSGRSYHFYGADVMEPAEYWRFLGGAQLMAPFVDERWIAHQLISGKSALRVSTNMERHADPPRVVAWHASLKPPPSTGAG